MRGKRLARAALITMILSVLVGPLRDQAVRAADPTRSPYRNVSPAELKAMLGRKDFVFVNVHIPYAGEIARTDAFIPFEKIAEQLHLLPPQKDAKIVLYCMSGRMSDIAANTLVRQGYTNVSYLEGGMQAWEQAGYPLIKGGPR